MANGLELVGNLAHLLTFPDHDAERQDAEQTRGLLLNMAGMDPATVDKIVPPPKPPSLFEKAWSPVTTLGTVLSAVLGAPVKAPRKMTLADIEGAATLGEKFGRKALGQKIAATLKNPTAIELAKAGQIDAAMKAEGGNGGSPTLWKTLAQLHPNDPQAQLDEYRKMQAGMVGVRGEESRTTQAAGIAGRDVTTEAQRNRRINRRNEFLNRVAPGLFPTTPSSQGGIEPQSAPAPENPLWTPVGAHVGDQQEQPEEQPSVTDSLRQRSVTGTPESASSTYVLPDYTKDLERFAIENNIDLSRKPTPEQARMLDNAKLYYQQRQLEMQEEAKSLPAEEAVRVAGLRTMSKIMDAVLADFTPTERAKYTGWLARPFHDYLQTLITDRRFNRYASLIGQLDLAKADFIGKQMSQPELELMKRVIPNGYELGGSPGVEEKIRAFQEFVPTRIEEMLNAHKPIGQMRRELAVEKAVKKGPSGPMDDRTKRLNQLLGGGGGQ